MGDEADRDHHEPVPMRNFGLVPNFVDIHPRTLSFDLEDAKKRLTKNTRAVLPVHWFGLPCDMDEICGWANQKSLIVLAIRAQAKQLAGVITSEAKTIEDLNS
jgi:dTDP-4-amino-4,6-dideoxygalactose transaminase